MVGELFESVAASESLCPCHGWLHVLGLATWFCPHSAGNRSLSGIQGLKQMLPSLEGGCIPKYFMSTRT